MAGHLERLPARETQTAQLSGGRYAGVFKCSNPLTLSFHSWKSVQGNNQGSRQVPVHRVFISSCLYK